MNHVYHLNPFALVTENDEGFLIYATGHLQVRFAKRDRAFLDLLMSGEPLEESQITRYLAPSRLEELRRKHVLLEGKVPPLAGRYSRQLGFFSLLSDDHETYQARLEKADVLLLGAGGIGSHVLWNLAAMGAKRVTVVDFDVIEETNLNRQLMYSHDDIGKTKVHVLCEKIARFNPEIEVVAVEAKIESPADVERLMPGKTLVIKSIDTPEKSTEWVNEICVRHQVPFITGGFLDYIGVVGPVYVPGKSLCASCIGLGNVRRLRGTGPTFGPLCTTVSSMMSMVAFKIIVGATDHVVNKLHTFNTLTDTWEAMPLRATRSCHVCGRQPEAPAAPARNTDAAKAWAYRGAVALMMLIATAIRAVTHDQYIGILVFCMLLLSVIYTVISLVITTVQNRAAMFGGTAAGFERFFQIVQQLATAVIQTAVTISFLFFILNAFMYAVRVAAKRKVEWIA
jgi:molybdopterin/thiamine biosynthesis adenylyltransferase